MSIPIKTPAEIESMRKGGHLLGEFLKKLGEKVTVGITPVDIEHFAKQLFEKENVTPGFKGYNGYPAICCISVNDRVVHSIPDEIPFKQGDLVTIDCGLILDGLNTDAAISVVIGGKTANPLAEKLSTITRKALYSAIKLIKPGVRTGDLSFMIQRTVEQAGFSIIRELTGHGVGRTLHEEPTIYNYGKRGNGPALKPGMTIAIEPITCTGERFIKTLNDHWTIVTRDGSLSCQWEHTVLVTANGHEILTPDT
ncbi:MAG: type I methionyl aminopeptidase [Candidatus Gracilibacteria bacterium]